MAVAEPNINVAQETSGNLATLVTNTTGLATAANQTTGNTNTSTIATNTGTIATNTPALGQAVMASSSPVVLASNQSTIPVSMATNTPTLQSGSTTAVTQATASNLNAQVVGTIASGASDSGNPVKIGGVYNSTLPTFTNGQRGDLQLNASGGLIFGGGTVASGAADANNPIKVGGVYNSSAPTFTTGQRGDLQLNVNGAVQTNMYTLIAGEDITNNKMVVEQRNVYSNVTATGTTTVKSGANFLHSITVNNPSTLASATTASTIKVYDNTAGSGTLIGTISLPLSANITSMAPFTIPYNVSISTGLTLVITLGTSGSWTPDITVNTRA